MTGTPRINQSRLWNDLMTLACAGATQGGGCDRTSLTDDDTVARNLFRFWCEQAGISVRVDAVGNMFARREGSHPALAPILIGSHLDTQSPGGKFDGALGVLASLEIIRALDEAGITTRRGVEVVNWTNEEGARFTPGLMGSGVFNGSVKLEAAYAARDRAGKSFGEELTRIGFKGDEKVGGRELDSYFELHVEQGPELEAAGKVIGAVTQSLHLAYITYECRGQNGHTQATKLARQKNAVLGAAKALVAIEGIAIARGAQIAVSQLDVWPNNRVNIPHLASFSVMIVEPERSQVDTLRAEVDVTLQRIGEEAGLAFTVTAEALREPVVFPEEMVQLVERSAKELGHSSMRLVSNAGHDALSMGTLCPSVMIFVPSRDGISHSELEYTSPEHCAAGAQVLLNCVLARAM